jgi:diketogulonate reductase-like aldo/keto reductase
MEYPNYPPHEFISLESNCSHVSKRNNFEGVNGLHTAAISMHHRLVNLLRHASSPVGFSRSSPSSFLYSYGVLEGVFYTLHLYEIIVNASIESRPPTSFSSSPSHFLAPISESIRSLESSLTYDADALIPIVFSSLELLETAKLYADHILNQTITAHGGGQDVCLSAIGPLHLNLTTSLPFYISSSSSLSRNQPIPPSSTFLLSNGVQMPVLGLGTWQLVGEECEKIVYDAIKLGYRHIDSAQAYDNEKEIGNAVKRALKDRLVTRAELFIATKLSFDSTIQSEETMVTLLNNQMKLLQVDYLDLYYLHSPIRSEAVFQVVWPVLDRYYRQGLIKAIGISNFDSQEIISLHQRIAQLSPSLSSPSSSSPSSSLVTPHALQNKYDIYHPGRQLDTTGVDIEKVLKRYQIQMVGYSPFSSFPFSLLPLDDPILLQLTISPKTKKTFRTVSDVIIQWMLQRGVAVIPRSSDLGNLERNLKAAQSSVVEGKGGFSLTEEEMRTISSISSLVTNPFFHQLGE